MALPHGAWVGLQYVIGVFPDHTHLLFAKADDIERAHLQFGKIILLFMGYLVGVVFNLLVTVTL